MADQTLRLGFLRRETHPFVIENADERVVIGLRANRVVLQRLTVAVIDSLAVEFNPLHFSGANLRQEFRIIPLFRRLAAYATESLHDRQQDHDNDDENKNVFLLKIERLKIVGKNVSRPRIPIWTQLRILK